MIAANFCTALLLLFALIVCTPARAAAEPLPQWELGAGIVELTMPDYRGSDEVRTYVLPVPYAVYRLEWLKADRSGVRSTVFGRDVGEVNLSLSATPPVRSRNNRARQGMTNIKPLVEIGPSVDLHLWRSGPRRMAFDVRLPLRAAFTVETHSRYAGLNASPTLNLDIGNVAGTRWQLGLLAGPIFANRRQNDYFYGVSEEDARADRPAFKAHGGYGGFQFLVAVSRRFPKAWVGGYARYDTLRGAVFEDSPLVRRHYYASAGFALAWIPLQSTKTVMRAD